MITKTGISNVADLEAALQRSDTNKAKFQTKQSLVEGQIENTQLDTTNYPALIESLTIDIAMYEIQIAAETDPIVKERISQKLLNATADRTAAEVHMRNYDKFSMIERQAAMEAYSRNIRDMLDYMVECEAMRPTLAAA